MLKNGAKNDMVSVLYTICTLNSIAITKKQFYFGEKMKRILITLSAFLFLSSAIFAEEGDGFLTYSQLHAAEKSADDDEKDDVQDELQNEPAMNVAGDKFIKIELAGAIPLNFGDPFKDGESQLEIGGTGSIGFYYFFTGNFALGMDLGFGYQPTIGGNIFNYIPLTIAAMFQPTLAKFEFPLTFSVGAAVENYLSETYFPGLILKAEAGAFYRITPAWSLGITGTWMGMPQWYDNPKYNYFGQFCDVGISMRYHFF